MSSEDEESMREELLILARATRATQQQIQAMGALERALPTHLEAMAQLHEQTLGLLSQTEAKRKEVQASLGDSTKALATGHKKLSQAASGTQASLSKVQKTLSWMWKAALGLALASFLAGVLGTWLALPWLDDTRRDANFWRRFSARINSIEDPVARGRMWDAAFDPKGHVVLTPQELQAKLDQARSEGQAVGSKDKAKATRRRNKGKRKNKKAGR